MKARSAEVALHLHMTEDAVRVGNALKEALGVEVASSEALYGHNGNLIMNVRATLAEPQAEGLLKRVLGRMGDADRARLIGELRSHFDDKGAFFLRLDKQELLLGRFVIGESDAIRLRIRLDCRGEEAEGGIRECLI